MFIRVVEDNLFRLVCFIFESSGIGLDILVSIVIVVLVVFGIDF